MRYVTLNMAKMHLNVEHSEDDVYIEHLATAAEQAVEGYIEAPLSSYMPGGKLPAALLHAILLVLGTLYANREMVAFSSVSIHPAAQILLQPYKKYV